MQYCVFIVTAKFYCTAAALGRCSIRYTTILLFYMLVLLLPILSVGGVTFKMYLTTHFRIHALKASVCGSFFAVAG